MRVKYPVDLILFLLQPSKNFGSEAKLLDPERIWSQTPGKGETAPKYPDTNDYHQQPFCGNQALGKYYYSDTSNKDYKATCFCGSEAISGFEMIFGKVFCCVSPGDPCYQIGGLHVSCPTGKKHLKTTPCHSQCYNSYNQSEFLWMTSASLYCHEEDLCLPVQEMCSGVCNTEGELCSFDVRCPGHGYDDVVEAGGWPKYTLQSLGGKVTGNREYCFTVNNDGSYDTISRMDEDKVTTKNVKLFEYEDLKTCQHKDGGQGISCKEGCGQNIVWCTGIGLVCTTLEGPVGVDNVDLCQNNTFWLNRSCDWYDDNGLNSVGLRCTGETKHCILPWYNKLDAYPTVLTECFDESDQAFPINTTCSDFNHQFLKTYKKVWCGEGGTGLRCDNLEEYFINQKVDKRIRDPHRCEESCITTGADCLACHHEDYFHCQTTGICIHHSNVCDGHPHPQCGGDDENMYDCYQTYVKKRIVKNYATFICDSVMYPGKVRLLSKKKD